MSDSDPLARLLDELRREGIDDSRVLSAMARVPRDQFVGAECHGQAYRNIPLPIGENQTISQPYVVALMTQYLDLTGNETVLEVGTGSGYQCAILAELSRQVLSVERFESLAATARARLDRLGYRNVEIVVGDGTLGYPGQAPYDAIIVTAASPRLPQPLAAQLAEGGRLVLPIGSHLNQQLFLYVKRGEHLVSHQLGAVRFVPLVGDAGWNETEAEQFQSDW